MIKLIKFYTQTCGPCKMMKPIVDSLIHNHSEVEYEEVDCTQGVPEEWEGEIRNVPTIIIIKGDSKVKIVGIKTYEYLEDIIKNE